MLITLQYYFFVADSHLPPIWGFFPILERKEEGKVIGFVFHSGSFAFEEGKMTGVVFRSRFCFQRENDWLYYSIFQKNKFQRFSKMYINPSINIEVHTYTHIHNMGAHPLFIMIKFIILLIEIIYIL